MELEAIKAMNLKEMEPIEICYRVTDEEEHRVLHGSNRVTRCGYFGNLVEMPKWAAEIPDYSSGYPLPPPFLTIFYALETHNHTGRDEKHHRSGDIEWLRPLTRK